MTFASTREAWNTLGSLCLFSCFVLPLINPQVGIGTFVTPLRVGEVDPPGHVLCCRRSWGLPHQTHSSLHQLTLLPPEERRSKDTLL